MIYIQILSKILVNSSYSIVIQNNLTEDHFGEYATEFNYIAKYYRKHKKVPDLLTFKSEFPDVEVTKVNESDSSLVDRLLKKNREIALAGLMNKAAEIYEVDVDDTINYIQSGITRIANNKRTTGYDYKQKARERFKAMQEAGEDRFIPTGFPELDKELHGILKGEELFVIFARTGQCKTWISLKMAMSAFENNYNVGIYSGEMSEEVTSMRIDTLLAHFSNSKLFDGTFQLGEEYETYMKSLDKHKNKIMVYTQDDFNGMPTVSQLSNVVDKDKLDILLVDQISLVKDETATKGMQIRTMYTNIARDLANLSKLKKIPIILPSQANRDGTKEEGDLVPLLHHISESDGISHYATRAVALYQNENVLKMKVRKNRFGKKGKAGLEYDYDIDKGTFLCVDSGDISMKDMHAERRKQREEEFKQRHTTQEEAPKRRKRESDDNTK